ncbi:multidrug ABC transporter ATP-binding protein [candidate division WOR-1 bacterium RIFOXYA12_FULL_43_27]|uniref:Multidrug ABC transporter ATP-binding protein n=1 Tax=candidate division WOR-1 bacterium RIFOXYC2_FULL_46_14 TaxID=1802587 RepID=A0A1F4U7C0_UNCSA|nr:MAG: multidrug ABC transporter ATP-binding protein [candidate division WOR-1 bacterium RIFOXYA12_FULL_43_27]OGC19266.1 MAG: multidrug ABC transporter ATP-binding protein [candidate division WOR-1 bacterium RIFOXYB2_FULL_46_45]OGC30255.1 MAG: multidrug ABC transporter ATP-binding protein [candidate division WOR-1 bacterium RIFOXYA2_FULL_46_56]OGC40856.1 MAG: multidrug ABC transporter ATP-binding protein [candidate division WOR-1 bacterium RIFOXYC2_FULL_46_14]
MSETAIEITNLVKKFGGFTAVNNISFNVNKGEIFGFLGPNGAGKTTTIRMLCGLYDPTSGTGKVGGYQLGKEAQKIKQNIGYMCQKFCLYDDLTIAENIDFYAGMYQTNRATRREQMEKILRQAELTESKDTITGNLSLSVKQHLALGCSIIHEPKIVFLDEPTGGVDPISRKKFWAIIKEMATKGITILVTTHYMDEAEMCDRIALISAGEMIACDSPANLKSTLMGNTLFEIEVDQVMKGLETLHSRPFSRDVSLYGVFLHVLVEDPKYEKEIRETLEEAGLQVKRIEKILPSLEDVFVFLVEKQQAEMKK